MNRSGYFITLEGGEGAGKSTQARLLRDRLAAGGREVVLTREPGGAPGAEAIRHLLVTGAADRWSPLAETLLFAAARDEHLRRTIRPALERGAIVICDRFADSTRAYQGVAGGVDPETVRSLEDVVLDGTRPDLTLILDIDPAEGLARAGARIAGDRSSGAGADENRFETKSLDFHAALRRAFLDIAAAEPDRCIIVDASGPAGDVAERIAAKVEERFRITTSRQPA